MKNVTANCPKLVDALKGLNNNYGRGEIVSVWMNNGKGFCEIRKQYGKEYPTFSIRTRKNGGFTIRFRNHSQKLECESTRYFEEE